jgi:hypothetical protein
MSIVNNVKAKMDAASRDKDLAKKLRDQSIEAILAGLGSPAWERYMNNFAENPQQLNRLMARDEHSRDEYMKDALVYLVANGVCFPDTVTRTLEKLDATVLDDGGL